jgi:hypothetical protein
MMFKVPDTIQIALGRTVINPATGSLDSKVEFLVDVLKLYSISTEAYPAFAVLFAEELAPLAVS